MDIEEVAENTPEAIHKDVDLSKGLEESQIKLCEKFKIKQ